MNDQEIKETVLQLLHKIAPDVDPNDLKMEGDIRETFGIDSFDFLQFIIGLDEKFGIKTPEEEYGEITSLDKVISYVKSAKKVEVE